MSAANVARAQYDPRTLQPIEQGRADMGPLSSSSRLLPLDLRQPTGFQNVYRVPGSTRGVPGLPGAPIADDYYARVNGAITAVFPRSDYIVTKKGVEAAIPGGTVFYIGNSPLNTPSAPEPLRDAPMYAVPNGISMQTTTLATPEASSQQRAVLVDRRVRLNDDSSFQDPARPGPARQEPARERDFDHPRNIFVDEEFRRTRVRQLLACGRD